MKVVLINPYELGRQPFGLAEATAWLRAAGCEVQCLDLSLQRLEPEVVANAGLVAIYVAMHTATRIAAEALPRLRALAPDAHLCAYGLYAPMNAAFLRALGVQTVLGGEYEPALTALAQALMRGEPVAETTQIHLGKIAFVPPDREALPALTRYAHLILPDGARKTVGFAEASRGCKHLCRHCPVVPVYNGRFRVVPIDVVMADVRAQITAGAQHISFGDPDFFNGPTHALRLVEALHAEFPGVTYDATIKIEHLLRYAELLPRLKETGCLFITSAVESVDNAVLALLLKNHTAVDFAEAVRLTRAAGIVLAPTFVPFTPWTTLDGYRDLLRALVDLALVESVPAIQLAIRLLVPEGSALLQLPEFRAQLGPFDPALLGYPWRHVDPRVDALQRDIEALAAAAEQSGATRAATFDQIWQRTHTALGEVAPGLCLGDGEGVPRMSEPWYCCAEPTQQQLQSF